MVCKRLFITVAPLFFAVSALAQTTQPSASTFEQTSTYRAYDLKAIEPTVSADDWATYDQTLAKRADEVLHDLALTDATKSQHVKTSVIAYYKFLRAWHDQHDAKMQELNKNATANAPQITAERKDLIAGHEAFLADLGAILTPGQVELVKDRLCYTRPTIMYEGFTKENAWLTPEQKAAVKKICDEARELAMDGGSSKEKHRIMDKYKGRLTNYIASCKKAAATQNAASTQPAQ